MSFFVRHGRRPDFQVLDTAGQDIAWIRFEGWPSYHAYAHANKNSLSLTTKGIWYRSTNIEVNGESKGTIRRTYEGELSADLEVDGATWHLMLLHRSFWRGLDMQITSEGVPLLEITIRPKWFAWPDYQVRLATTKWPEIHLALLLVISAYMIAIERLLRGNSSMA